jgi:hypothetical protein
MVPAKFPALLGCVPEKCNSLKASLPLFHGRLVESIDLGHQTVGFHLLHFDGGYLVTIKVEGDHPNGQKRVLFFLIDRHRD